MGEKVAYAFLGIAAYMLYKSSLGDSAMEFFGIRGRPAGDPANLPGTMAVREPTTTTKDYIDNYQGNAGAGISRSYGVQYGNLTSLQNYNPGETWTTIRPNVANIASGY